MIWWHSISNPHVVQSRGQRRPVESHHLLRCHGRFAVGHWLRSGCGLHGCLGTVLCRYLRWIVAIHVLYDMHIQIQYIHIYIQYLFVYESMILVYLWEAYKHPISIDIITLCVTPLTYSVNLSLQKEQCGGMERNVSFTWYFKSIGPAARTWVFHQEAGFVTIYWYRMIDADGTWAEMASRADSADQKVLFFLSCALGCIYI